VPVFALMLASVRVGDVEVPNVEAVVMPAAMPHVLLGNSFLTRFSMKRDADTMRLERR
jgi:aspartyl protease family protein